MARNERNFPIVQATNTKLVALTEFRNSSRSGISYGSSGVLWTPGTFSKAKSSAESYLILEAYIPGANAYSDSSGDYIRLLAESFSTDGPMFQGVSKAGVDNDANWAKWHWKAFRIVEGFNAGQYTVECGYRVRTLSGDQGTFEVVNPNWNDDDRDHQMGSRCWVWELAY